MRVMGLSKWIICIALCLSAGTALAQASGPSSVDDSRAESFQTVKGPAADEVSGGRLLLAAYGTVWLILMLYVFRIERLSRRIHTRLEQVEIELSKADQHPAGPKSSA
jgi:hypothetical protein